MDPDKLPYYLLLVGGSQAIPLRFQYHLDVQHAVGRIHFVDQDGADDLGAHANFARGVIAAETRAPVPCRAVFVGVQNPNDMATALSASELVQPLSDQVAADQPNWQLQTLLGGEDTPALHFTTSHGARFPAGDARPLPHRGALLCQDWPEPTHHQEIRRSHSDDADIPPQITELFRVTAA